MPSVGLIPFLLIVILCILKTKGSVNALSRAYTISTGSVTFEYGEDTRVSMPSGGLIPFLLPQSHSVKWI